MFFNDGYVDLMWYSGGNLGGHPWFKIQAMQRNALEARQCRAVTWQSAIGGITCRRAKRQTTCFCWFGTRLTVSNIYVEYIDVHE